MEERKTSGEEDRKGLRTRGVKEMGEVRRKGEEGIRKGREEERRRGEEGERRRGQVEWRKLGRSQKEERRGGEKRR